MARVWVAAFAGVHTVLKCRRYCSRANRMCGKYILAQAAKAERAMGIRRGRWEYPQSWRVLPSEQVPVVVDASGEHEAAMMRWGLIPYWANGVPLKASTINATVERLESAPSYRDPWARGQRCIFVMGGFYEPHVNADGSREPFFVHLPDHESWLEGSAPQALAALRPYSDELMVAWKVSRRVNSPRLPNEASLIDPA